MLTGFDHVTIVVRDLDAAVAAYQRLLGAPPHWRGGHPELGTRSAIFALSNAAIELYGEGLGIRLALDRELAGTRMLFFRTGGVTIEVVRDANAGDTDIFYGVAYRVRDIAAAHARMRAAGLDVSEVRDGRKPGT